jgi:hypothetical protein
MVAVFLFTYWQFSAIPWAFTYLLIGKTIGPNPSINLIDIVVGPNYFLAVAFRYSVLLLLGVLVAFVSVFVTTKIMRNRALKALAFSLLITFLIMLSLSASFSVVFMPQVSQADKKIDVFVNENKGLSFQNYVADITVFLNDNVRQAYGKPEASFEINRPICSALLDSYIMKIYGVTAADLIVYQGWGSCEESAILIEELLHQAGYETRLAYFIGIDHEWAEVKYNGTWWIVDPWEIGNLVAAINLRNMRPAFQQATGVEVQYENGTLANASQEHGY